MSNESNASSAPPISDSDWVATLPNFEQIIPSSTSSIIPRFSLFSLFTRTPSAPKPTDALLEPLHDLIRVPTPSLTETRRALRSLGDYVRHVQKSSKGMTPPELAQALGRIGEAYVVALSVLVRTDDSGLTQGQAQAQELFDGALAGAFEVYRHHPRQDTTREILAAVFEPTALSALLCPLFENPRTLLLALGHAARASPLKIGQTLTGAALSSAEVALQVEPEALAQSHRLEAFALQLGSLSGLDAYPFSLKQGQGQGQGKGKNAGPPPTKSSTKKKTKAETKKEAQDRAGRPMRIALEAELLRAELAMSMATARIEDIKRRAGGKGVGEDEGGEGWVGEDGGERERSASSAASASGTRNRKRRALTDESEFEMHSHSTPSVRGTPLVDIKPSASMGPAAREGDALGYGEGVAWEDRAESALLRCLVHARNLVQTHRAELLTEHIQRSDWLDDGAKPVPSPGRFGVGVGVGAESNGLSPVKSRFQAVPPTPVKNGDDANEENENENEDKDQDEDEDDATSTSSLSSHSTAEEDLSHPCPLRALFRLHDRYEEQRLAVWMGLPSSTRGKMGAYMRGRDGRVGAAWDALGLGLLIEYDR